MGNMKDENKKRRKKRFIRTVHQRCISVRSLKRKKIKEREEKR